MIPIRFIPKLKPVLLSLAIASFQGGLFTGCGSEDFRSEWRTDEIVVDGNHTDWGTALKYMEGEKAAAGSMNDGESLYICFVTSDQASIVQVLRGGLTVWFAAQSEDATEIGLRYPLRGVQGPGMTPRSGGSGAMDPAEIEERVKGFIAAQREFRIVNEHSELLESHMTGSRGAFEVTVGFEGGQLVYEMKAPLAHSNEAPIAIGAAPGGVVEVHLESELPDRSEMMAQAGGRPSGGRGGGTPPGGGMGGGRGGSGGGRGGGRAPSGEEIDVELSITLAKGPK
ncbi:MAG: hypothetical protein WBH56_02040 [Bacteroidota bacterium]